MKNLALLTARLTLLAVLFYAGYRGLQFYHELIPPPAPVAGPAQPGKLVTTISLTVIREVVPPPAAPAIPPAPPRRR